MIDVAVEQLVHVRMVPRLLPPRPNGRRVHISAVYRWMSRGVRGVRLESVKVGGSTYTSVEALQRFADRLSEARPGNVPGSATLTRCRQKQIDDAAHEVERILGAGKARHSSA